MIPAFLLLAAQASQATPLPEITEYPAQDQEYVAIEAIIDLPKLNPSQRYVLSQAMNIAVQMTPEFGNRDVLHALRTGTRFKLYQAADHLRIGLAVENDDLTTGLSLLRSVITQPTFLTETIKARHSAWIDPWAPAYSGYAQQETPLDHDTMAQLWQAIMKPKNISVAVSGRFRAGVPTEKWRSMQALWQSLPDNGLPLKFPPKIAPKPNPVPIILFDSKPITISRTNMAAYFLAANSLGVGKDSILWSVAREEMNLSYRQESFLMPTESGWVFRMAFATDAEGVKPETISTLRQKIRARCEALTQADLDHAVGLGRGYLVNEVPTLPLIIGIGSTVSNDSNDQLYLKHYWALKFGFIWDRDNLFQQMQSTKLDDLKKLLLQLIDESNVRTL